jgi:hypothetical protein
VVFWFSGIFPAALFETVGKNEKQPARRGKCLKTYFQNEKSRSEYSKKCFTEGD